MRTRFRVSMKTNSYTDLPFSGREPFDVEIFGETHFLLMCGRKSSPDHQEALASTNSNSKTIPPRPY